jgi:hypothetical protein
MLISKYPLLAQDKSWEKKLEKSLTGMDGVLLLLLLSQPIGFELWTLNFELWTHTILWTGQKGTTPPPTFPVDGYYKTFLLPFSFVPKALGEPAYTGTWPPKKKKKKSGAFFLWMVAIVAISQNWTLPKKNLKINLNFFNLKLL